MSAILDQIFTRQVSEDEGVIDDYSELLGKMAESCPEANVVCESQQYSRIAAIQQGNCTIYEPEDLAGEELPFNPEEVGVQITYFWDRKAEQWELAWVATWPYEV